MRFFLWMVRVYCRSALHITLQNMISKRYQKMRNRLFVKHIDIFQCTEVTFNGTIIMKNAM